MSSKVNDLFIFLQENNLKKEAFEVLTLSDNIFLIDNNQDISEGLRYHIDNKISLSEPIFRINSKAYFDLITEASSLHKQGKIFLDEESLLFMHEDIGKFADYNEETVPLDFPMVIEEEESILKMAAEYQGKSVSVGKPKRIQKGQNGYGRKKFVVYVKDGDKIKRIVFGDPNLSSKPSNPKARKSFRARHKCHLKKDRTTPGYWACRYPPNW